MLDDRHRAGVRPFFGHPCPRPASRNPPSTLTNIDPIKNMHRFYGVQIVRTLSANGPLCAGGAASDHPAA